MTEQVPPSSSSPGLSSDWEPDVRLADLIDRTTVGAALHHATLTLFPIFASDGQSPPYDLLEDALARGTVVIREVSQAGHVPEVHIDNRGERPVLIIDGDVLVGAKQNRVANLSVLVPAKTQFVLPVSCVEAGRWYYQGRHFEVRYSAPPHLRSSKCSSMLEAKRRKGRPSADQTDVWGCVDHVLSDAGSASPTRSLTDAFKSRREQLDVLRSTLRLPPGAVGFMLGAEGRIVGLDLFGETSTADRYWPRLSEAYFLEAVKMPQTADPVPVESARRFLTEVRNHAVVTPKAIGLGREIELKTDGMTGQGLLWRGRIVHLSAFERPSWDDR